MNQIAIDNINYIDQLGNVTSLQTIHENPNDTSAKTAHTVEINNPVKINSDGNPEWARHTLYGVGSSGEFKGFKIASAKMKITIDFADGTPSKVIEFDEFEGNQPASQVVAQLRFKNTLKTEGVTPDVNITKISVNLSGLSDKN